MFSSSQPLQILFPVSSAVVLSSDEEEDADNASTGSANRLDSVSPRPADSAHSSPAPSGSGGRVEAAVKNTTELDEFGAEFFEDVNLKVSIPRKARMKDQVSDSVCQKSHMIASLIC